MAAVLALAACSDDGEAGSSADTDADAGGDTEGASGATQGSGPGTAATESAGESDTDNGPGDTEDEPGDTDDSSTGEPEPEIEPSTRFADDPVLWNVPESPASAEASSGICSGTDQGFNVLSATQCRQWSTLDLDGDGRVDLVSPWDTGNGNAVYGFGSQNHHWLVFLGGDTGFAEQPIEWSVPVSPSSVEASSGICDGADQGFNALSATQCRQWSTVDINGDGALDLVSPWDTSNGNAVYGFGSQNHHWRVFLGGEQGFADDPIEWSVPVSSGSVEASTGICDGADQGFNVLNATQCRQWSTVDIDGDGRLDLVSPWDTGNGNTVYGFGSGDHHWRVFLGGDSGFADDPISWSVPDDPGSTEASTGICDGADQGFNALNATQCRQWSTVDMDGDGRLDLVSPWDTSNGNAVYGFGSGDHHWRVFAGGDSGFADDATTWTVPVSSTSTEASSGICDGADQGFNVLNATQCRQWSTVDIDGDGLLDLVSPWDTSNGNTVHGFGSDNHHWQVFLGTGSGFATTAFEWSVPASATSTEASSGICDGADQGFNVLNASQCRQWSTTDIDGDGRVDLVSPWDTSDGNAVHGFGGDHHWLVFLGE